MTSADLIPATSSAPPRRLGLGRAATSQGISRNPPPPPHSRNPVKPHTLVADQLAPILSLALIAGGGCATAPPPIASAPGIRSNAYSLLYDLLDQQRNVDKLLLVKLEKPELGVLIKAIAAASQQAEDRIRRIAREDRSIRLDATALPEGERETRRAIAHTKTKELLIPFNPDFELTLLLTQFEALSYATHLARIAAEHELDAPRREAMEEIGKRMEDLYRRTFALIQVKHADAPGAAPPRGR